MISPDGLCKTFDISADGYGRGEGCGMVVLKLLSQAQADGDPILALIRGSAINQDGPSSGLTVPNGQSQQKLILQALKQARVKPGEISYLEAHGTGTSLGDPIEVNAAAGVLGKERSHDQPLWIGSVKTNIGHLESAAGVSGLIKVVLSLQHQEIPGSLHLEQPNPKIDWQPWLQVPQALTPWVASKGRFAGVSSFGFTGTNAHVVLCEAPPLSTTQELEYERPLHLLQLSAKNELALGELAKSYREHLQGHPEEDLADICFSANSTRSSHNHRLVVIARNREQLQQKLDSFGTDSLRMDLVTGIVSNSNQWTKVAMLFTGQGSQSVGMGRQLYQTQPTFKGALDECNQILLPYLEKSIFEVIYPENNQELDNSIDQTANTQPALFAIEYALYKLWESWGIKPDVVMGHSVGEYVAACIAGVFSLEDGLKLIAHRGRLMQQLPTGGEMLAVMASEEEIKPLIASYSDQVAIAAINGPSSIVISGESEAIEGVRERLDSLEIKTKQLQVSHGFHSHLMEPMLAEFMVVASEITYNQPTIPLISNVTGAKADNSITEANYWVNHVRQPVKFAQSMETLHQEGYSVFLEIGAKPTLLGMVRQCLPEDVGVWLPSLRPNQEDTQQMLHSLGELYVRGVQVDWLGFDSDYPRNKVVLPTYPFQRQRYWIETNTTSQQQTVLESSPTLHPLLGQKITRESYFAGLEKQNRFQSLIEAHRPEYLHHHQVFEQPLLPATAYWEIALAAGKNLFPQGNLVLEDVIIQKGLILPSDNSIKIQTVLTPREEQSYQWQIFSAPLQNQEEQTWQLNAQGIIKLSSISKNLPINREKYQQECSESIDVQSYYQQCQQRGFNYGSSFQGIKQLWSGQNQALAKIELPAELIPEISDYQLHPAFLDSALQVIGASIKQTQSQQTYLPLALERLTLYRSAGTSCWVIASFNQDSMKGEIKLIDEEGNLIAQMVGLKLMPTTAKSLISSLQPDITDWFYQINWLAQPGESTSQSPGKQEDKGKWLILVTCSQIEEQIELALEKQEQECIFIYPESEYQQLDEKHYQINPQQKEHFQQLLQDNSDLTGIIHLWGILPHQEGLNLAQIETTQDIGLQSLLHLGQALIGAPTYMPPLWLVTRGTQNIHQPQEVIQPQSATLWGMGKVMALEHPEINSRLVDLDGNENLDNPFKPLIKEILGGNEENQIAYRQGRRYVARLSKKQLQRDNQPQQLKISAYGNLDNLKWQPHPRRQPQTEEVEMK